MTIVWLVLNKDYLQEGPTLGFWLFTGFIAVGDFALLDWIVS